MSGNSSEGDKKLQAVRVQLPKPVMSGKSSTVHILQLLPIGQVTKASDERNFVAKTRADDDECAPEHTESNSEDKEDAEYECVIDSAEVSNLVCDICSKQFKYEKNLQNHLIRHSRKKASQIRKHPQRRYGKKYLASKTQESESAFITCEKCGVKFENENVLKQHSTEEHGEDVSETEMPVPSRNCNSCGRTFKSVGGRKRHVCSYLDEQQNNLKQHSVQEQTVGDSESQVDGPVECYSCKRTFKSKRGLQHHKCRDLEREPYICEYCGRQFHKKQIWKEHVNIHTRKKAFICEVCNQIFAHLSTLRNHRNVAHIHEKSHICKFCGKGFICSSGLKAHVRVHTRELPYECDVCHRRFNWKGNLTQHYYVHTGEYPFSCDVCKKGFKEKRRLLDHYVTHTDPQREAVHMGKLTRKTRTKEITRRRKEIERTRKEIVCDVCGKTLPSQSKLKRHYRVHTGERPYKCEECGMSFKQKIALKVHSYRHTKEYPFICLICDRGCPSFAQLMKHQLSHSKHSVP